MTVHYQNPYLPHTQRGTAPPRPVPNKTVPITKDAEGLPVGTAAQVMTWVGDDPDRAQAFLTKEQRENRPRVSLVANLKAVLKRHEIVPPEVAPVAVVASAPVEYEVVDDEEPINQLEVILEKLRVAQ